jgi:hypothetical protein
MRRSSGWSHLNNSKVKRSAIIIPAEATESSRMIIAIVIISTL